MGKPRVIIADTDLSYIFPLQYKFAEEFGSDIDLEIVSDSTYFDRLFSSPQRVDVLIVSEELYSASLHRHSIGYLFLMTERYDETVELSVIRLFKYTSVKEIFSEIVGKSADALRISKATLREPRLIVVTSGCGGTGKTTVAMGICTNLVKNYKKVLYINADRLQSFQHLLENGSPISSAEVYSLLLKPQDNIYGELKHVVRTENFSYLPAFKAPLLSLGLNYSVFERIAQSAKKSGEFDFVVVDADCAFDEEKANLISAADRVIVVTRQNRAAVFATNQLTMNINGVNQEKYIFVCNDFSGEEDNALISPATRLRFSINEYVEHMNRYDQLKCADLAKEKGIQKVAFLIM